LSAEKTQQVEVTVTYLREVFINASSLETPMHLSGVLQCDTSVCMAPPEIELIVDLGVGLIPLHKQFRLLEVGERLEGKVRGFGVVEEWEIRIFGASRISREFPRWNHLWR
jgi:hypothetical protein